MAATPTTKAQVQAYRFVLRRMEHALVRKDAVMLHDPMRTQVRATAVGLVLGLLGLAGFALFSVFRPAPNISQDVILVGKTSLTTFVVREEDGQRVAHPVLNLASARLVAGTAAAVSIVADSALKGMPRGPLLGIPGAPNALPSTDDRPSAIWTVCDRVSAGDGGNGPASPSTDGSGRPTTSVIVGSLVGARPLTASEALYVRAPDGSDQLLFAGRRAVVDTSSAAVVRALNVSGQTPRPASAGLLNAIPEVPQLGVPTVPGVGTVPRYPIAGAKVGEVVDVKETDATEHFLVLTDGVQKVDGLVASLLVSSSSGHREIGTGVLGTVPNTSAPIRVEDYPAVAPTVLGTDELPVSCLSWDATAAGAQADASAPFQPRLKILAQAGLPLPASSRIVPLASAAGGPGVAAAAVAGFYLEPGQGAVVRARDTGQPAPDGTRFLVSDTGTRFGISSGTTAEVLGLGLQTAPAPSAILALLPQGPALSTAAALRAHDGVAADPAAVQLPVPTSAGPP